MNANKINQINNIYQLFTKCLTKQKSMKSDQANTPTHVVSQPKEHLHVNAFEHTLRLIDLHVHHRSQNVHTCPPKKKRGKKKTIYQTNKFTLKLHINNFFSLYFFGNSIVWGGESWTLVVSIGNTRSCQLSCKTISLLKLHIKIQ